MVPSNLSFLLSVAEYGDSSATQKYTSLDHEQDNNWAVEMVTFIFKFDVSPDISCRKYCIHIYELII